MSSRRSILRRLLFAVITVVVVLGATELVARLVTGPPAMRVVLKMPDGSPGALHTVDAAGRVQPVDPAHRTWWPPDGAPPVGPRVVWLGGSSLAGPPGPPIAAGLIQEALGVDTVNLAIGGSDTGHLLAMMPLVRALHPTVVVIYSGHNDIGNALFTDAYADPSAVRIARARQLLGRSRVFGLLEQELGAGAVSRVVDPPYENATGLMSGAQRRAVLTDYRHRLRQIVHGAQDAGATVILSTVVSNPSWPSARAFCPDRQRAVGVTPSTMGRPDLTGLDREKLAAERARAVCWDLDYLHALDTVARGEPDVELLQQLRDLDPAPLRAGRDTNTVVRELAAETGAVLVDTARSFQERGGGVEPARWFTDNVHLTDAGHQALAASLAPAIAAETGAGGTVAWPAP